MFWDGFNTPVGGDFLARFVLFDDNYTNGVSLPPPQGSSTTASILSHYAVDWVEVYEDGTFSAIVSARTIYCMWPQATICTGVSTMGGSPEAAPYAQTSRSITPPQACTGCNSPIQLTDFVINLKYSKLLVDNNSSSSSNGKKIVRFGGLHWEAMKYIAGNSGSIIANVTTGWSGVMGNNATHSTKFRFLPSNPNPTLAEIEASGALCNANSFELRNTLTVLTNLAALRDTFFTVISDDEAQNRRDRFATARDNSNDIIKMDCCKAIDVDYLDEEGKKCCVNLCGGECCPDQGVVEGRPVKFVCQDNKCITEEYYCGPPT